jgi:hypothetical protein
MHGGGTKLTREAIRNKLFLWRYSVSGCESAQGSSVFQIPRLPDEQAWMSAVTHITLSGRREPNLMILKRISEALDTRPNWLLGITSKIEKAPETAALIERFVNAARGMTREQLKLCVIQAEAVAASNR